MYMLHSIEILLYLSPRTQTFHGESGPPKEIKKILEARNVAVSKLRFAHTNFPQIFKVLDKIINLGKHFSKNKKNYSFKDSFFVMCFYT